MKTPLKHHKTKVSTEYRPGTAQTPIRAKTLLSHRTHPDPWFGCKYNMNIYRGCQHQCIYCDSRSECYHIKNFEDILYKENVIEKLKDELPRKRTKGTICFGAMSDPYIPLEAKLKLTKGSLEIIAQHRFPIHLMTKSDLVLRDKEIIKRISEIYATVSFTITTTDDELAKKIEPHASLPSARLKAMKELSDIGIYTGITMMPILPFIEDTIETITQIVQKGHEHGAQYILPSMGMTLRDRQRNYYYKKLDKLFPGVREKYEKTYGDSYSCGSPKARELEMLVKKLCEKYDITTKMVQYKTPEPAKQLGLLA